MTQYEILRMASIGISARLDKENEINELTKKDFGRENGISVRRIEKLEKQFAEVMNMMGDIEKSEENHTNFSESLQAKKKG